LKGSWNNETGAGQQWPISLKARDYDNDYDDI
jgi:hypothetical protein